MQVTDNTPKIIRRRVYFNGRTWDAGTMITGSRIVRASWPDGARRVYWYGERAR